MSNGLRNLRIRHVVENKVACFYGPLCISSIEWWWIVNDKLTLWRFQQLRICSGHFRGGRKSEGDIPVADPDVDDPIRIDISALVAVKHTEKSPKCRRMNSATATPTGQKLAASTNSGMSLCPNVGLSHVSPVSGCGNFTNVEPYSE